MSTVTQKLNLILAASFAVALAQPAFADRGHYRRSRVDVDIESLKAKLVGGWGDSMLQVRCKVEIEDAYPGERFDLMLRVTDRGRELADRRGQPLRVRAPLDRPTDIDDDEIEFDERLELRLPDGLSRNTGDLRIWAKVVDRAGDRVLDRDDASITDETYRTPRLPIVRDSRNGPYGGAVHNGTGSRHGGEVRRAGRSQRRQTVQHRETRQRTIKKTTKTRTVRHSARTVRQASRRPAARAGVRIVVRR